jgi:hypothetical protein
VPALEVLSLCTCELTAAGLVSVAKAGARLASFLRLRADGNAISERGVEEATRVLRSAGKVLEDMEDNDQDGEDDLEDGEDKGQSQDEHDVDELAAAVAGVSIQSKE